MVKSMARARCGSEVVRSMVLQVMRISGWCMLDPDIEESAENAMAHGWTAPSARVIKGRRRWDCTTSVPSRPRGIESARRPEHLFKTRL